MDHAQFSIDCARREVSVNGQPVPGVRRFRLEAGMAEVPVLTVEQLGDAEPLEGTGVVQVVVAGDVRGVVLDWLEHLDPETLEQQALDQQGWGSGRGSLAATILKVLGELAKAQL